MLSRNSDWLERWASFKNLALLPGCLFIPDCTHCCRLWLVKHLSLSSINISSAVSQHTLQLACEVYEHCRYGLNGVCVRMKTLQGQVIGGSGLGVSLDLELSVLPVTAWHGGAFWAELTSWGSEHPMAANFRFLEPEPVRLWQLLIRRVVWVSVRHVFLVCEKRVNLKEGEGWKPDRNPKL